MSLAKVAVVCGLMALLISACGIQPKPEAGTPKIDKAPGFYGTVDDPRKTQVKCLKSDKLPLPRVPHRQGALAGDPGRPAAAWPDDRLLPDDGIAQGLQIMGQDEAAEVIGTALVYPNHASAKELKKVETCTAIGVKG